MLVRKIRCTILLITALFSVNGNATPITTQYTDLGSNHWSIDIGLLNDGVAPELTGFTLYFSPLYKNLVQTLNPSGWDSLVIPSDDFLQSDGFLDSFLTDPLSALANGQAQNGFRLEFDFIGNPSINPLRYDIVDYDYNILSTGFTSNSIPTSTVPEPAPLMLFLLGLSLLSAGRISKAHTNN